MSTRNSVEQLIALASEGKLLEAFDRFYAEDVSMQENSNPPTTGKAANRKREEDFLASVAQVHEARAVSYVADENTAAIYWILDFTNVQGTRLRFNQVALQTWQNGKIINEQFFYDTAALVQNA
jgi:ketosteroid isomerase-like protein